MVSWYETYRATVICLIFMVFIFQMFCLPVLCLSWPVLTLAFGVPDVTSNKEEACNQGGASR
jgi:hypothetical protein